MVVNNGYWGCYIVLRYRNKYMGIFLSVLFICLFTFNSYAVTLDDVIVGKAPWEDVYASFMEPLNNTSSYDWESTDEQNKMGQYIYYSCTSYNRPYDEYEGYVQQYRDAYAANRADGSNYFYCVDEDTYNAKVKAGKKLDSFGSFIGIPVADSGFRVDKNGFPFQNLSLSYKGKMLDNYAGVCKGMAMLSAYMYVYNGLGSNIFFATDNPFEETYKRTAAYKSMGITSSRINISGFKKLVENRSLGTYKPDTSELQRFVDSSTDKAKTPLTQPDYSHSVFPNPYDLRFDKIDKDSTDYNLLLAILRCMDYGNTNPYHQQKQLAEQGYYSWDLNNFQPAEVLDLVADELKAKRPVLIGIFDVKGYAHAIVGYKLTRDTLDMNKYYLYCYDSNFPNNSTQWRENYDIKITLVKVKKGKHKVLSYRYAPYCDADGTPYQSIVYDKGIEFSTIDDKMLILGNTEAKWGQRPTNIEYLDY